MKVDIRRRRGNGKTSWIDGEYQATDNKIDLVEIEEFRGLGASAAGGL